MSHEVTVELRRAAKLIDTYPAGARGGIIFAMRYLNDRAAELEAESPNMGDMRTQLEGKIAELLHQADIFQGYAEVATGDMRYAYRNVVHELRIRAVKLHAELEEEMQR